MYVFHTHNIQYQRHALRALPSVPPGTGSLRAPDGGGWGARESPNAGGTGVSYAAGVAVLATSWNADIWRSVENKNSIKTSQKVRDTPVQTRLQSGRNIEMKSAQYAMYWSDIKCMQTVLEIGKSIKQSPCNK